MSNNTKPSIDPKLQASINEFVESNIDTFIRKNSNYGRDNITATGESGIAARAMDKVARLVNLTNNGGTIEFEDMDETWGDLFNYSIIGYLMTTGQWSQSTNMVYLAGPIDDIPYETANTWREWMKRTLSIKGITAFDPAGAFSPANRNPNREAIRSINRHAILQSNVVVANLSGDGRGFGTIREIEFARANNIRVIVVGDVGRHFDSFDVEIVDTLLDAVARLTFGK